MVLMNVPHPGDRVVVAPRSPSDRISVTPLSSGGEAFEVHRGEVGEVVGVTQYVVDSGRYIQVKFTDKLIGYIHESNLSKV